MPALYLFHRRTLLGGDDLQPAAFITTSLRFFQLVALLIPVFHHILGEARKYGGLTDYTLFDPGSESSCRHSHFFPLLFVVHAISSLIYCLLSMILEWRIAYWSSQGTPTVGGERSQKVSLLLEYKLLPFSILLFLIWLSGTCSAVFIADYRKCVMENESSTTFQRTYWLVAFIMLLLTQFAEFTFSWSYMWGLCRRSSVANEAEFLGDVEFDNQELIEQMWADRCSSACRFLSMASCFLFGGKEIAGAEFSEVARALSDYFEHRGVLDVVPSDIVAGLMALQQLQRLRVHRAYLQATQQQGSASSSESPQDDTSGLLSSVANRQTRNERPQSVSASMSSLQSLYRLESNGLNSGVHRATFDPTSQDELLCLEEATRYIRFALAIYTWALYLYDHPCTGPASLFSNSGCACCCRKRMDPTSRNQNIIGDNMCETHKATLLWTAGLEEADIVYVQLRSGFSDNPYCILLDHEWRSVVLSVRGTFSLEDCVTDVLIEPESLERLGQDFGFDGNGEFCHGGVLACVRNIYRDLRRHGCLEQLLLGDDALYPDYTLRLVGHSLGAATCTVLSYMLRKQFPSLRCVNYSPPGCSLTWKMATACKSWCTTVVLGSDLVPRLSLDSMDKLRNEVLELLGRLKVSKVELARRVVNIYPSWLYRAFFPAIDISEGTIDHLSEVLFEADQVPESQFQQQLLRFKEIQEGRRSQRGESRSVQLFPPGQMLHLVKCGETKTCAHNLARCITCYASTLGAQYQPVWIQNDDLDEIFVSSSMGIDHFPNRIRDVLESVWENTSHCDRSNLMGHSV